MVDFHVWSPLARLAAEQMALAHELAYQDRLAAMRERAASEGRMRAIMGGVIWRASQPVLAQGWDDWSRLVRMEGWR